MVKTKTIKNMARLCENSQFALKEEYPPDEIQFNILKAKFNSKFLQLIIY